MTPVYCGIPSGESKTVVIKTLVDCDDYGTVLENLLKDFTRVIKKRCFEKFELGSEVILVRMAYYVPTRDEKMKHLLELEFTPVSSYSRDVSILICADMQMSLLQKQCLLVAEEHFMQKI